MSSRAPAPRRRTCGVALLALLVALALMGVALLSAAETTALTRQRAREQELLFVGDQYRQAIERFYYAAPPGTPRLLPQTPEQLLLDDRYPQPVQHLRRLYLDPFTGEPLQWVRQGDRLSGVRSAAQTAPLKRTGFAPLYVGFAAAADVSQWVFLFKPPLAPPNLANRPPRPTERVNTP